MLALPVYGGSDFITWTRVNCAIVESGSSAVTLSANKRVSIIPFGTNLNKKYAYFGGLGVQFQMSAMLPWCDPQCLTALTTLMGFIEDQLLELVLASAIACLFLCVLGIAEAGDVAPDANHNIALLNAMVDANRRALEHLNARCDVIRRNIELRQNYRRFREQLRRGRSRHRTAVPEETAGPSYPPPETVSDVDTVCAICTEYAIATTNVPCGHALACGPCATTLDKTCSVCSKCRGPVEKRMPLYLG